MYIKINISQLCLQKYTNSLNPPNKSSKTCIFIHKIINHSSLINHQYSFPHFFHQQSTISHQVGFSSPLSVDTKPIIFQRPFSHTLQSLKKLQIMKINRIPIGKAAMIVTPWRLYNEFSAKSRPIGRKISIKLQNPRILREGSSSADIFL